MNPSINEIAQTPKFRRYITDLLVEICRVDTTPRADLPSLRSAEQAVFDVLEREAGTCAIPALRAQRIAIRGEIATHRFYSRPYYATTSAGAPASDDDVYRGRGNLLLMVDGESPGLALNAHVDVVHPYIAPRVEKGIVFGRGACDDKGPAVAIMAALRLVGEHCRAAGTRLQRSLTVMFVIEEEMGGNGSLSLAIDRELKRRYDSLLVAECTGGRVYPGCRGALWYKIELHSDSANCALAEAAAFIIEELEKEGRSIRAESRHELFPHRPVQTCHGVIGRYGEHPSRINGRVDIDVVFPTPPAGRESVRRIVDDVIGFAIAEYVGVYGDKTAELDAAGNKKVDHHYDLIDIEDGFTIQIHGSTGHMGSILANDCAITKMATIARALLRSRAAISAAGGGEMRLELHGDRAPEKLVMEGGQGFLPTHDLPQVMRRLELAAMRGAAGYARVANVSPPHVSLSFDKLHNEAFAGRADSPSMRAAIEAAKRAGAWRDEPVRGWDVSCDSRIFACEYPEMDVLTAGPGELIHAHADNEQIALEQVAQFAAFLAHYILLQAGEKHTEGN